MEILIARIRSNFMRVSQIWYKLKFPGIFDFWDSLFTYTLTLKRTDYVLQNNCFRSKRKKIKKIQILKNLATSQFHSGWVVDKGSPAKRSDYGFMEWSPPIRQPFSLSKDPRKWSSLRTRYVFPGAREWLPQPAVFPNSLDFPRPFRGVLYR